MDKTEIRKLTEKTSVSVAKAMQRIDANSKGILFLVDEEERLAGCLTDGDIRRFMLAGGKLDACVMQAANASPKTAQSIEEANSLYHSRNYIIIPVLNGRGEIVDLYAGEKKRDRKRECLSIPVVINAGGKGTRLDPFTKILPKPLIPVGELPIIEHIMREYQSYGCDDFHMIVNYKKQLIKAYFAENEGEYRISWHDEEKPLGTGGGLSLLRGKIHETFFFTNCDNLMTADYAQILRFHKENQNVITMVCAYKNLSLPYGVVEMGVNGRIESMKEKPVMSFLTNTGIYIVEPQVLEDIEDGVSIGFPDIMEQQRLKGRKVAVFPISENDWMDMGQMEELEKMRRKLYGE